MFQSLCDAFERIVKLTFIAIAVLGVLGIVCSNLDKIAPEFSKRMKEKEEIQQAKQAQTNATILDISGSEQVQHCLRSLAPDSRTSIHIEACTAYDPALPHSRIIVGYLDCGTTEEKTYFLAAVMQGKDKIWTALRFEKLSAFDYMGLPSAIKEK